MACYLNVPVKILFGVINRIISYTVLVFVTHASLSREADTRINGSHFFSPDVNIHLPKSALFREYETPNVWGNVAVNLRELLKC